MEARYSITDDRFDISDLENKKLIMEFQMDKFVFIVFNSKTKQIEWLEDFSINSWAVDLAEIFESHQFLKANFWQQIGVIYHVHEKAIVPNEFIGKVNSKALIPNLDSKDGLAILETFKLNEERSLVYRIPKVISDFLKKTYTKKTITGLPSEVCLPPLKNSLLIQFYDNWVSFYAFEGGLLNNSKTIKMKNASHFNELLAFFYEGKKQIVLLGAITNYSPFFNLIKQQDGEMDFGDLHGEIKFSQYFSEVPKHKYFTIFNSIIFF